MVFLILGCFRKHAGREVGRHPAGAKPMTAGGIAGATQAATRGAAGKCAPLSARGGLGSSAARSTGPKEWLDDGRSVFKRARQILLVAVQRVRRAGCTV